MQHHSNHCKHLIVSDDSNDVTFFAGQYASCPKNINLNMQTTYALSFKTLSKRYTNDKCKLAKALIIDIALHGQNRANTLTTRNSESSAKKFKYKLQETVLVSSA